MRKLVMAETLTIRKFKGDEEALPQKMCFATFSKLTTCFLCIFCCHLLAVFFCYLTLLSNAGIPGHIINIVVNLAKNSFIILEGSLMISFCPLIIIGQDEWATFTHLTGPFCGKN